MDARTDSFPAATADREIVITRVVAAPRELVWDAMTNPEHVVHWWGPRGFTTTVEKMDVRPGGEWKHVMHGPDGADYPNYSVFQEVVKPERLVFAHGGGKSGSPGAHFVATWTFEAVDDRTRVTIHMLFRTPEDRNIVIREYGAVEGGKQTLQRLDEFLARGPVIIERILGAPVATVWKAITEISQMRQWYFPQLESFDPRTGFRTQFNVHNNGKDFLHIWTVREAVPDRKISYDWKYGGFPGESRVAFELFPEGGKSRLRLTHSGLETFKPEENPHLARGNFETGWKSLFSNLEQFIQPADGSFVIARTFDAPRALMFRLWTDPEHMQHWWGPKGAMVFHSQMDLRPGGTYHYGMRTPDDKEMWGKFVYREIVTPERLVFVNCFSDSKGGITRHPMNSQWPLEMLSTVTFTEQEDRTTVTVHWTPVNATEEERRIFAAAFDSMRQGWGGTFEQLGHFVAELPRREVSFTRIYDAPCALVWRAWTDPENLAQWWGPQGFTNPLCEIDLRPGGGLRIVMRAPDGTEYPMSGIFEEIVTMDRLVFSTTAEDKDGNPLLTGLVTVTFSESDGKTHLTVQSSAMGLASTAAQMLEGMKTGWEQSLARLSSTLISKP